MYPIHKPGSLFKRAVALFLCIGTALVIVAFIRVASNRSNQQAPTATPKPQVAYDPRRVCEDAWQNEVNHENDAIDHFYVDLHEGCFSGFVYLPKYWQNWDHQPVGDLQGWWIAYWWSGQNYPHGPFGPNNNPDFQNVQKAVRLQGHGRILFFTNAPPKHDSSLPSVLFKTNPEYSEEARRAHFNGDVTALFIVTEEGRVTDIRVIDSPGMGLDDKIIEALKQWKFKPAMKDGVPVAHESKAVFTFRKL